MYKILVKTNQSIIKIHPRLSELPYLLAASILPLFLMCSWLFRNNQLPLSDGATYLYTSIDIYHHFIKDGVWSGLVSSYLERGWRPVFFTAFAVPFLLIYKGNLYWSYYSVIATCVSISLIYTYLLFRLRLDCLPTIIATNIIGLLNYIQGTAFNFFPDMMLFPCLMGCIYHLIQSDYLRNMRHASFFMVLFIFATVMRPVESISFFMLIFSFFIFLGWRKKIFNINEIKALIILIMFTALLFLFAAIFPKLHMEVNLIDNGGLQDDKLKYSLLGCFKYIIIAILALLSVYIYSAKPQGVKKAIKLFSFRHSNTLLIPVSTVISILSCLWFLPFAFELYQWAYRASVGDIATSSVEYLGGGWFINHPYPFQQTLVTVCWWGGGLVLFGAISLALIGFIMHRKENYNLIFSTLIVYLLLTIPIPIFEVFFTVQCIPRKLIIAFPAFIMVMLIIGLYRGRMLGLRIMFGSILLIAQFIATILLVFSDTSNATLTKMTGWTYQELPVSFKPNPHDVILRFLSEQTQQYHFKYVGMGDLRGGFDGFDSLLMSVMAFGSNENFSVIYPYFSVFTPDVPKKLLKSLDAIFIYDEAKKMTVSPSSAAYYLQMYNNENNLAYKIFDEFLALYSSNQLKDMGWRLGPCLDFQVKKGLDYRGCLLIPA